MKEDPVLTRHGLTKESVKKMTAGMEPDPQTVRQAYRNSRFNLLKDDIVNMYRDGKTQADIATHFRTHQATIGQALKRWGEL